MGKRGKYYNGVLLLNKRSGITSHDAVQEVRRTIRQRRVGHTGTLDPRAEGLLIVCMGRATKLVPFLTEDDKTYEAEICLGQRSATYDQEGVYQDQPLLQPPDMSVDEFQELLESYRGRQKQTVPAYSAVHVNGRRLYEITRSGESVELPEREIEISEIRATEYRKPYLKVVLSCSKGTYVRSLANDIGERLQCGAYLSGLKRVRVGRFQLEDALEIDDIDRLHQEGRLGPALLRYDQVLQLAALIVTDEFRRQVINGRDLLPDDVVDVQGRFDVGDKIVLKDLRGRVLAIGESEIGSTAFEPKSNEQSISERLFKYIRVLN
jgi:tRNA pseudouridine55 synthase